MNANTSYFGTRKKISEKEKIFLEKKKKDSSDVIIVQ
jgi:hypothetical protein